MRASVWAVALPCALICAWPSRAAAQSGQEPPTYLIEYSSIPMTRNAALVEAGLRLTERTTDWAVDELTGDLFVRRSTAGFLARAGKWTAFDWFLTGLGTAVTHEYGHATRVKESGDSATVVIRWFGRSYFRATGRPFTPAEALSVFGGGLEGQGVLAERVQNRIYLQGTATPEDLSVVFVNAERSISYVLKSLSEGRLASPERLLDGGRQDMPGDPVHYALSLTAARLSRGAFTRTETTSLFSDIQSTARSIRRGSLINLIDFGLMTATVGLFRDYIWNGERHVPVRWLRIGSVSLVPSLSYRLSPIGPERQVRSRYKVGLGVGQGYVRWTEPLADENARLLGAGFEYQRTAVRRVEPKIGVDIWRNPDGTHSAHAEAATTWRRSPGDRMSLSFALGAKGRGYLFGHPTSSGVYLNAGAGIRF